MSSAVSSYADLPAIRSALFNNPPDTVPPTDELEILHAELTAYKVKSLELAKKAGDDIRTIEESMRRLKEKEKGKAKAIQKAERERAFTPSINGDESRASAQPLSQPLRTRPSSVPVPPMPTPQPSRPNLVEELKKNKKKKRKREDSSDLEPEPPKTRKPSPLPAHTHPHPPPPPQKPNKYPSTSLAFSKPANAPAFDLPTSVPLLSARPPVAPRPVAGPSKPTEVMEDFSKSKQPSQVQVNTFYTSIEPWMRPVKEEDVGFLQYTADEVEPFIMPKLGRHYSALWEEEDIAQYGGPLPGTAAMRVPDYSEAVDDPIATALRHAQRELRTVLATNKVRRARLAAIAEDRLAYQEYVDGRDAIDKNIQTLYGKLQKKDGPKVNKKKKQKGDPPPGMNGTAALTGMAALPPCPAALGLSPDEHNQLHIPEQLSDLVRTRRNWVDIVGGVFEDKERIQPGRIVGFPAESVYEGIDDEVRLELERISSKVASSAASVRPTLTTNGHHGHGHGHGHGYGHAASSKGKGRAGDEMDLG
ncbi:hypothetical protein GSI_11258 [Ganoderma sinense ZZ0214-1]|uniref:Uncharacterized protein n=1 Tax=Ganoderma sinense ZZ0214-1 TaxID=1077348 RepID=A0A2G8RYU1_9APHY|nr:hypothetical protein GSI_11258 [Ganoderma sinense ZZ0214-1]